MIAALALSLAVGAGAWPSPVLATVSALPPEPGAVVLPERQTYQAVVADLDGDGSRELVRLVHGVLGSIMAEVWRHGADGWARVGDELEVIPELANGSQANLIYAGTPARLIVRTVGSLEHVTLVRQPRFEDPDDEWPCCLQIHDIHVDDGQPRLRSVAAPTDAVDAVLAIDLDGDGTDELLATRSLPPLGRTAYPSEAYVYRWRGGAFGVPTLSELSIGSGDIPFVLGDTDGRPGLEAGLITSAAQSILYRLVLDDDDRVRAESSGIVVSQAMAVPMGDRPGVAVIGPLTGLAIYAWPPGQRLTERAGTHPMTRGRLIELVELRSGPALVVEQADPTVLHVLGLPDLDPAPGITITRSPTAASLDRGPLEPFRGPLPRGGADGRPAAIYAGRLIPAAGDVDEPPFPAFEVGATVAFGGAEPIGLAGPDGGWLALLHGARPPAPLHPAGGPLDTPALRAASGIALVPVDLVQAPERDFGELAPELRGALTSDDRGTLTVGESGFVAVIRAPAGSRVYVGDADPSVVAATRLVPEGGRLEVPLPPPRGATSNPGYRASLTVVSPAGATYAAGWTARTLSDAPPLSAAAATQLGSSAVTVDGRSASYATVTVDGRAVVVGEDGSFEAAVDLPPWPTEVVVTAIDPLGNEVAVTLSGVGFLDYRSLPWVPILIAALAGVAVVIYLRAPRRAPSTRVVADGDGVLEDLDPG